jgi:hypothetical protein
MWLFQTIEVVSHLDKAKVNNWFIRADTELEALAHVAARNRFGADTGALVEFLDNYYNAIIMNMSPADPLLDSLEKQNGLQWWKTEPLLQALIPDPEATLADIVQAGVANNVLKREQLERFVIKTSGRITYRLIAIEFDKTPF